MTKQTTGTRFRAQIARAKQAVPLRFPNGWRPVRQPAKTPTPSAAAAPGDMWSELTPAARSMRERASDPDLWDEIADCPARRPTLTQIGRLGATVIGPELSWLRRHVETVTLQTLTSARRQLTIDLELPESHESSFRWRDGERLCYLPVALLLKDPPSSNLDMLDERNGSLPVLNRLENAEVTHVAVMAVIVSMYDQQIADTVAPFVQEAIFAVDRDVAKANVIFAITRMLETRPAVEQHPDWRWLARFLVLLSAHSLNWIGLAGLPGERRILKFVYDIRVEIPKPFRRRAGWTMRAVKAVGAHGDYVVYYPDWDPGDGYPHGFLTRMVKRFVTVIGGSAYHIPIETPYIRNAPSYHLQVQAPDGLETRRTELLASLVDRAGNTVEPVDATTPDCAHLYFSEGQVARMGKAIVSFRVGRRGLLSYSFVACAVIATMLWEFAEHSQTFTGGGDKAAPAAILLLVPTLMLVFAIRPGEHRLATQLLSGVRAVLAAEGLLCVAAAAALVGIHPFHESVHTLWRWSAEVATILGLLIGGCWVFSFSILEPVRARLRTLLSNYWAFALSGLGLVVLQWLWLSQTARIAGLANVGSYTDWLVLGSIGLLGGWVALFYRTVAHPPNSRMVGQVLLFVSACCVVAAASRASVGHGILAWRHVRLFTSWALVIAAAAMLILFVMHTFGVPGPEPTINDEELFFMGPSGVAAPEPATAPQD
jgi:hypothetical protein